jgi:N-acetylglucosaminyl-diphospho-decaprenol L-rhamnosyltransferase
MQSQERQIGDLPPLVDLSVVIVNWNTRDLLARCLESVITHCGQADLTTEILVVDNSSADGSAEMVREQFPQAQLIENSENVGFARANNQAIRPSCGRYVLLLNPDTEVRPGALQRLVRFMAEHPAAGAAGTRLLNPDGTLQSSCHPAPTLARELWRLLHLDALRPYAVYPMARWDLNKPRVVEVIQGACLILRRATLDQVGWLDEDYFMYSEEVDLCYRLRQAGWQLYWLPQAKVVHYGGQSTQQVAAEMFLQLYQAKLIYFRKNHGWPAAQAYKLILLVAALARLLLSPLAWLEGSSRRQRHLTLTGHYRRLLLALPGM